MDFKRISDSQTEVPISNQQEQFTEKPIDSASGILSEADQLENAATPSFFSGKLLNETDFVDEQNYLEQPGGGAGGSEPVSTAIDTFIWFDHNGLNREIDRAAAMESTMPSAASPVGNAGKLGDSSKVLENFRIGLDAMHGEPRSYDELQSVVQQLRDLLQSANTPPAEKSKLQSEIDQLDEMSHTMNIQPQQTDDNFTAALQLLQTIRSQLSQYVTP